MVAVAVVIGGADAVAVRVAVLIGSTIEVVAVAVELGVA